MVQQDCERASEAERPVHDLREEQDLLARLVGRCCLAGGVARRAEVPDQFPERFDHQLRVLAKLRVELVGAESRDAVVLLAQEPLEPAHVLADLREELLLERAVQDHDVLEVLEDDLVAREVLEEQREDPRLEPELVLLQKQVDELVEHPLGRTEGPLRDQQELRDAQPGRLEELLEVELCVRDLALLPRVVLETDARQEARDHPLEPALASLLVQVGPPELQNEAVEQNLAALLEPELQHLRDLLGDLVLQDLLKLGPLLAAQALRDLQD